MARITLKPDSILRFIPTLVPNGKPLSSTPEALAALIHAINSALELQLIGVDESSTQQSVQDGVLPENWNARSPDFTFKYREPQSNEVALIKVMKVGGKSHIHGVLEQKEQTTSMDITTSEFVSPTYFQQQENEEPLVHGYVSSDRIAEFTTRYVRDVLRPLFPDLNYEARERSSSPPPRDDERPRRSLLDDRENNAIPPPSLQQPFSLPQRPNQPFSIGSDDLNPNFNPFPGTNPFPSTGPRGMFGDPNQLFQQGGAQRQVPWPSGAGPLGPLGPYGRPVGSRYDEIGPVAPNNNLERRPRPGEDDFPPPGFRGGNPGGGGSSFGGGNFDNMYM